MEAAVPGVVLAVAPEKVAVASQLLNIESTWACVWQVVVVRSAGQVRTTAGAAGTVKVA